MDERIKLTKERGEVMDFLREYPLGALATVGSMGVPEVTTIYFHAQKDFSIYFVTKKETRKVKNVLRRPQASLLTFDEAKLTSAELIGRVEMVNDALEFAQTIEKFHNIVSKRKAGNFVPPIAQIEAGQYVACKLIPTTIHFKKFAHKLNDKVFPRQVSFSP